VVREACRIAFLSRSQKKTSGHCCRG
jgi:hypothetical protein